jgi:hypothetical protein
MVDKAASEPGIEVASAVDVKVCEDLVYRLTAKNLNNNAVKLKV